jgi:HAD superfamily hydrolase (TIGR01509 family)
VKIPKKLILFDLDDTLIHFDDYWKPSLIETFQQHKYTKDLDAAKLFAALWKHNGKFEVMYHNKEITLQQFRNYRLIDTLIEFDRNIDEEIANDFNNLHKGISRTFMKSDPLLIELLVELRRSYSLGIVTNGTSSWQQDKIEAMGIASLFDSGSVIISEEIGYEKPAKEIYEKALSVFEVSADNTVFVGDSWANDVVGPARVGISSIWFNKKCGEVPKYPKLIGAITDIQELRRFL